MAPLSVPPVSVGNKGELVSICSPTISWPQSGHFGASSMYGGYAERLHHEREGEQPK